MRGKADLLPLEIEDNHAVCLLEVGDHRRAALDQGRVVELRDGAELGEAVLSDRPARLDEPAAPATLDRLRVELPGERDLEPVRLAPRNVVPEAGVVLECG